MTLPPLSQEITAITFRVEVLERDVKRLNDQLQLYVPSSINDLRIQGVQGSVNWIAQEVNEVKRQLVDMNTKLIANEQEAQRRDAAQKASQDRLQIRVLIGVLTTIVSIASGVLVLFLSHFFH